MKKVSSLIIGLIFMGSLLGGSLLAAGCSSSKAAGDKEKIASLQNETASLHKEINDLKAENKELKDELAQAAMEEITVYFMGASPTSFYLVPEKRKVPAGGDLIKAALEELVKGPYSNSSLQPTLPKGSRLLGVRVEGKKAIVDFNAATQKNLNVGSSGEALVIASIVNTVTEFPELKEVQILIEGKKVESLAGHVEATKPFTRNEKVIRTTP